MATYDIRYKPAFAAVFVTLQPGEEIVAEAGAMTSMDAQVSLRSQLAGNPVTALLKRAFGRESLWVNVFKNDRDRPLQLVLAQPLAGDIEQIQLGANGLCLQPGAYIASSPGVTLGVAWAGFASFLAGEGLFKLKASGSGTVFVGAYGGLTRERVRREFVVDSGHLVAYEPGIKFGLGLAGSAVGSATSGEGLVNRLRGDGIIYLQSRSIGGLVRFLRPRLRS